MKHFYKSSELAHIWVHDSETVGHGRCASAMTFNSDGFYSYGTMIAKKIRNKKGVLAVIINNRSYSITTSGHQIAVRSATNHLQKFYIEGGGSYGGYSITSDPEALFDWYVKEYAYQSAQAAAARPRQTRVRADAEAAALSALNSAQQVKEFFGLKRKVDSKAVKRLQAKTIAEKKKAEAEEKKAEAARVKRNAELIAAKQKDYQRWMNGEQVYTGFYEMPTALRINPSDPNRSPDLSRCLCATERRGKGMVIHQQSSGQAMAEGWRSNGETLEIGRYRLDAINSEGIIAGCHRIKWAEVERFANVLGLTNNYEAAKEAAEKAVTERVIDAVNERIISEALSKGGDA